MVQAFSGPLGGRAAGAVSASFIFDAARLDALAAKSGANVERQIAALAIATAAQARVNIRTVGAIDTGFMVNTTEARQLEARVWTIGTAADYGIYIEEGTRSMPGRPWLAPAMAWARGRMPDTLRSALLEAL